jgi:uncharacterized alkaline shock family protein YloU
MNSSGKDFPKKTRFDIIDDRMIGGTNMEKNIDNQKIGTVKIADDVVAMIAGIAATEIDGVTAMVGNISNELMSKMGMKTLTKGVRVDIYGKEVRVELAVNMEYGFNVISTANKVQERVKNSIENMTGLEVRDVNVRIAAIRMPTTLS